MAMSKAGNRTNRPIRHRDGWRIRWTDEHGIRRSEKYAETDYELADVRLAGHIQRVREIKIGLRTGTIPDRSFRELAKLYKAEYAPTKRSVKTIISIIDVHLLPFFGALLLREISSLHVQRFIASRGHLAKKTVANFLTLLRAMLYEAHSIGWLAVAPKIKVPRCRRDEFEYRYLRNDDEIRRFLSAAREEGEAVWIMYKTAVYLGPRAGELAALQPGDVDLQNGLVTIQRSFNGPTKSGDLRRIPIFNVLRADLIAWMLKVQSMPVVFPNGRGKMHTPSARVFQEILHRVLDRAGFPTIERNGKRHRYITFHGLRHTFASHFMMRGGDLYTLKALLGHKNIEMTQRYAHLAPHVFEGERDRFGTASDASGELISLPIARSRENKHG